MSYETVRLMYTIANKYFESLILWYLYNTLRESLFFHNWIITGQVFNLGEGWIKNIM